MPLDPIAILAQRETGRRQYESRDAILYALGVGAGRRLEDLPFVYEGAPMRAIPTMACLFGGGATLLADSGIDFTRMLHAEQRLSLHRPLPTAAEIVYEARITQCLDRGAEKGALLVLQSDLRLAADQTPLCTLVSTVLARGDGGFGGSSQAVPPPHATPERPAERRLSVEIRPEQAALYRLSGDLNPLHIDPRFAAGAGFERPILHGLCTYGSVCRALVEEVCGSDSDRIAAYDARFSSPVYPGETIVVDLWRDGPTVSFRAAVEARGVTVLSNGRCVLRP